MSPITGPVPAIPTSPIGGSPIGGSPVDGSPIGTPAAAAIPPVGEGLSSVVPEPQRQGQSADVGNMMFEDFFPKLVLDAKQEASLAQWFKRDLKSCVKHVSKMVNVWAKYRAVYMMEYVEKFYPSMGLGANFSSGVLCEKMLKGMDRLSKSVFTPRPMFIADDKTSNLERIDYIHRAEWFLHTTMMEDLEIEDAIGLAGIFDYLLDGSMVLEADQMYEKVPQRTIKTYTSVDALMMDQNKILNQTDFAVAVDKVNNGTPARVLIEEDLLTKNGLQTFLVNKIDHLVPPNVYSDRDIRFRARRMYLTESDLRLLASDGVGWYDKDKVEKILDTRASARASHGMASNGDKDAIHADEVQRQDTELLGYNWRSEWSKEQLKAQQETLPYKNTFAVYRITCKYGYKTGSDKEGLIPKYCTFDFEPESDMIPRARTYPHFTERKNYFHFKLGHAPKSYYGFGYGARLIGDDFLESNVVDLYLEGAAMATFQPFVCVHPEVSDGIVPFTDGLGPGKIGYVRQIGDFQTFDIPAPPEALLRNILPLTKTRSENKTSITSLVQGKTEKADPRAPAAKAQMLLKEAWIGLDSQIKDWNRTGWEPLAKFVWAASYENAVYQGPEAWEGKITFPGLMPEMESTNIITLEELSREINWKSQAASDFVNSEIREATFFRHFSFFTPIIQQLAVINPELYKKYFMRWMRWAAEEMQVRGLRYLIPTAEELGDISVEQISKMWEIMLTQIKSGQDASQRQLGGGN